MKLAIVGSGISGLVAAYRLNGDHEITLFEANDYLGGHTNTVDVAVEGVPVAVDTGFIVFNDWTYPNFIALLDELGVDSRPTSMSFSVHDESSGVEYNGHSLDTLFAQRRNLFRPGFHRMVRDILRFNRHAPRLAQDESDRTTVGQFLHKHRFSREFADWYLLPMGAAIWSCPTGKFADFPIRFLVEFYKNHGLLNLRRRPTWRVVEGGSRSYVCAMAAAFESRIRLRTEVLKVRRLSDRVLIQTDRHGMQTFDHVIFACHSDQALRILGEDATATERELLSAFPYEKNEAVLHTDTTLLPKNRKAWACWNYRVTGDRNRPACVTYNMNLLQHLQSPRTLCVTLNDTKRIAAEKVLRRFSYAHPVFTSERATAQKRHHELLHANRTSYCGAYWGNGFHEAGVNSALAVVDALRKPEPSRQWQAARPGVMVANGVSR